MLSNVIASRSNVLWEFVNFAGMIYTRSRRRFSPRGEIYDVVHSWGAHPNPKISIFRAGPFDPPSLANTWHPGVNLRTTHCAVSVNCAPESGKSAGVLTARIALDGGQQRARILREALTNAPRCEGKR